MKKEAAVVLTLLFMAVLFAADVNAQLKKENSLVEVSSSKKDPVKIVSFKIGGAEIRPKEEFAGSDDWLKDLQTDFENVSGKTATHIEFALLFPRPEEQKGIAPLVYPIRRRDKGEAVKGANSGFEMKASSEPNITSVSLLQEDYDGIRYHLDELNYPNRIKQVKIYLRVLVFDDGTTWQAGSWFKIDPTNPKNLIEIENDNTHGNRFNYRAKVKDAREEPVGR